MTSFQPFQPDWASPPGDTISDLTAERGLARETLLDQLALSDGELDALASGDHEIDPPLAERLERALGPSRGFWLAREALYRAASKTSG